MKKIAGRSEGGLKFYIEKGGVSPLASGKTPVPPKGGSGVPTAPAPTAPSAGGGPQASGSAGNRK